MAFPSFHRMTRAVSVVVIAVIALFMVAPVFFVVPVSFSSSSLIIFPPAGYSLRWYEAYFTVPEWTRATVASLMIASLTTVVALLLGVPAALALVRGNLRGKAVLAGLFLLPLVAPVILIAIAEFGLLSRLGLIGTIPGLVIAHTTVAMPFVVVVISATLRRMDANHELAAMSLGANPLAAFYHVTLPLLRPGIIIASLLAFIASFNEFLITLFVIGASEATLPIQLWKGDRFETNPTIAAASTIFLTVSSLTLLGVEAMKWRQRRMTGSSGDLLSG